MWQLGLKWCAMLSCCLWFCNFLPSLPAEKYHSEKNFTKDPTLWEKSPVLANENKDIYLIYRKTKPMMPVTTMLVLALAVIAVGKKSKAFR